MTNNKTNVGGISYEVSPHQKRRLYFVKVAFMVMCAVYSSITAISVLGYVRMSGVGLQRIATMFLIVGIGSAILTFATVYHIRDITGRL